MKHKPRKRIIPRDVGRCGFTLIELLLVIAIVTVLSTMALGVMRQATTDAKISATEARLRVINSMMEVIMEDYSVRRMPFDLEQANQVLRPGKSFTRAWARFYRNRFIAELVDVELPRPYYFEDYSITDNEQRESVAIYVPCSNRVGWLKFFDGPGYVGTNPSRPVQQAPSDLIGDWREGDYNLLGRLNEKLQESNSSLPPTAKMQRWEFLKDIYGDNLDLPGEYLYQFLYSYDFDGTPAVEALGSQAIADTDGDNLMEVVDAFGEPLLYEIQQLRSPSDSFVESANPHDIDLDSIPDTRDERGSNVFILRNEEIILDVEQPTEDLIEIAPRTGNMRIVAFSSRSTQDLTHYFNPSN